MSESLEVARDAHCWRLTLRRADKMNALDADLVEALIRQVEQAHADGARVLVFEGAGKNFSAGFDQGSLDAETDGDLLLRLVRIETLLQHVAASPCLTVALARGRNFGAGVDLFAACKWRLCTADASFRMPGLNFGLVLGSRRFADLVGRERAREILEQTATLDAARAHTLGLVTKVIEPADWPPLVDEATRVATTLDRATQAHLYRVLAEERADQDMADLVRSASRPGPKARMTRYLQARTGGVTPGSR